jgi:hypothetical protein
MITRRLGPDPRANARCVSLMNCPDILECEDGAFLVIGEDVTESAKGKLALGASCGPSERIIRIPRETLTLAKADIPSE